MHFGKIANFHIFCHMSMSKDILYVELEFSLKNQNYLSQTVLVIMDIMKELMYNNEMLLIQDES